MNSTLRKLGQSKILLYVLFALSLANIIGYLVKNNVNALVLFIVIGVIMTFITKNMIYILAVTLLLTNFLISLNLFKRNSFYEGLNNKVKDVRDREGEAHKAHDLRSEHAPLHAHRLGKLNREDDDEYKAKASSNLKNRKRAAAAAAKVEPHLPKHLSPTGINHNIATIEKMMNRVEGLMSRAGLN